MPVDKQSECLGLTESFSSTDFPEELQVQFISEALHTRPKEDKMHLCQLHAWAEGTTGPPGVKQ